MSDKLKAAAVGVVALVGLFVYNLIALSPPPIKVDRPQINAAINYLPGEVMVTNHDTMALHGCRITIDASGIYTVNGVEIGMGKTVVLDAGGFVNDHSNLFNPHRHMPTSILIECNTADGPRIAARGFG